MHAFKLQSGNKIYNNYFILQLIDFFFLKKKNIFFLILVGLHVQHEPRQLRHGNVSPVGGMGETKGNVHSEGKL